MVRRNPIEASQLGLSRTDAVRLGDKTVPSHA